MLGSLDHEGPVVVNPSSRPRSGVVEVVVAASDPPGPAEQVVSEQFALPGTLTLDAATVRTLLGVVQGTKLGDDAWVHAVEIREDESGIDLTVSIGAEERADVPVAEMKQDLYTRLGARPGVSVRVILDRPPIRRVAARANTVPGFGWRAFAARSADRPRQGRRAADRGLGRAAEPCRPHQRAGGGGRGLLDRHLLGGRHRRVRTARRRRRSR